VIESPMANKPVERDRAKLELFEGKGSCLCLTLDGKKEEFNVDFVLSPESFEA